MNDAVPSFEVPLAPAALAASPHPPRIDHGRDDEHNGEDHADSEPERDPEPTQRCDEYRGSDEGDNERGIGVAMNVRGAAQESGSSCR